jgi:acetolactate synthase-1/2/3 large subunit
VTTLLGIGALDTTHDLSLHMLGMHGMAYANYAVEDCDFLIAVGSRFDDRVAGMIHEFAPRAKFIAHLDIDAAEIGKVKRVNWSFVGDARTGLSDLIAQGRKSFKRDFSKWVAYVQELKRRHALNYDRNSELIQPYYVIECLNEITKGEAIVSTGVGQHQMWAAQYFDFKRHRSWLTSGSMGTMGFGLPAAIGAQAACPVASSLTSTERAHVNLGELETATTTISGKVLLMNNLGDGWGSVAEKCDNNFSEPTNRCIRRILSRRPKRTDSGLPSASRTRPGSRKFSRPLSNIRDRRSSKS